jgi:hypothetical protein
VAQVVGNRNGSMVRMVDDKFIDSASASPLKYLRPV